MNNTPTFLPCSFISRANHHVNSSAVEIRIRHPADASRPRVRMTEVMSELLSNFWAHLKQSDPSGSISRRPLRVAGVDDLGGDKEVIENSIFSGEFALGSERLNSLGQGR